MSTDRTIVLESTSDTREHMQDVLAGRVDRVSPFAIDDPDSNAPEGQESDTPRKLRTDGADGTEDDPSGETAAAMTTDEDEEVPRTPKGAAQRVGKLTREREDARRVAKEVKSENAQLLDEINGLKETLESLKSSVSEAIEGDPDPEPEVATVAPVTYERKPFADPKPLRANFNGDIEKYDDALDAWRDKRDEHERAEDRAQLQAEFNSKLAVERGQQMEREAITTYDAGLSILEKEIPGVRERIKTEGQDLPWNFTMRNAVLECSRLNDPDTGGRVMVALLDRPEFCKKIEKQTRNGLQSAEAFNLLVSTLIELVAMAPVKGKTPGGKAPSNPPASAARPSGATVSATRGAGKQLSPPPKTVGGSPTSVTSTDMVRLAETDPDQFRSIRNQQEKAKHRRH